MLTSLIYFIFLLPIGLDPKLTQLSFAYALLPILYGKFEFPKNSNLIIKCILILATLLLFISILLDPFGPNFRRIISYIVSIAPFGFIFLPFNKKIFSAASISILVFATFNYSLKQIYYILINYSMIFDLKSEVGTQRIGMILLVAILLANYLFLKANSRFLKVTLVSSMLLNFIGIVLTFSRTSYLTSIIVFLAFINFKNIKKFFLEFKIKQISISELLKNLCSTFFIILLSISILALANHFLSLRLISFLTSARGFSINDWNYFESGSSEGYRLYIWGVSLKHFLNNIFLGSGFLGCWNFTDDPNSCSFHNQHIDTIVRHGIFLSSLFFIFALNIFKTSLKMKSPHLFASFIAYFIFGFGHETFRNSDPSLVMSFLLWCTLKAPKFYYFNI